MKEKQKKVGFIGAIESKFGLCPTISGACVILAIVYVFMNVDLFKAISESENAGLYFALFVVIAGLVGGSLLTWMIVNCFKRKVGVPDTIAIMLLIAGIGSVVMKYVKDGIDFKNIPVECFVFLAVAVIAALVLIIHSITYKFEENQYCNYKQFEANSNFVSYYKNLFKTFQVVGIVFLAILCVAAIFIIDMNPEVSELSQKNPGKLIICVISGVAVLGYIIGLLQRAINKKVNIVDIGIFMVLIASIFAVCISLYRYLNKSIELVRLIISIAAFVFGLVSSFLLIKNTYIPVPLEEKEENENAMNNDENKTVIPENKEEEDVVEDPVEEVKAEDEQQEQVETQETAAEEVVEENKTDADEIYEDEEMAEQIKAIIEKLNEQTVVNTTMNDRLNNIDKNLQLIADILSGMAVDTLPIGTRSIQVPIDNTEEAQNAVEETTMTADDYFDQAQEEQKVEEANTEIADSYASSDADDDFLSTADDNVRIKPKMSFEMKLRVADEDIKRFYSDIKNELLSYGIHDRISRHRENFNQGRINICRIVINGKTLKIYLAVDPTSIDSRYFHHEDVGHRKGLVDLPTMINVRSKVSARKVKELIGLIMESLVISKKPYEPQDFASELTLDGYTTVECKGFSHLVKKKMTLEDSETYPDTFAQQLVEVVEDESYQEKFIKTELTLDDISNNFNDGDVVDIAAIREKKLGAVNSNYLSIKESQAIDKKFKVYANEMTPNAVKMVCLSGGEVFIVVQPENTVEEV